MLPELESIDLEQLKNEVEGNACAGNGNGKGNAAGSIEKKKIIRQGDECGFSTIQSHGVGVWGAGGTPLSREEEEMLNF